MGMFTELNEKLGHHFHPVDERCMITMKDKRDLLALIYQLTKAGKDLETRLEVLEEERERRIQRELANLELAMRDAEASNARIDDMMQTMLNNMRRPHVF